MSLDAKIEQARALLATGRICVLSGAGISAESGLQTFRAGDGLWEEHRIEDVATPEGFARDPERVWRFYNARRWAANKAQPNPGHRALAGVDPARIAILTQNIDGLHQDAGSRDVVELHGSLWTVRCSRCAKRYEDFPVEVKYPSHCSACAGLLRPHVVWFGEPLDMAAMRRAEDEALHCDVCLVVGTSANVHPAASIPLIAGAAGAAIIEVNLEPTPVSNQAKVALHGKAGEILPRLFA